MASFIGRNAVVTFASTTLTTNYRSNSVDESVELVDKSSGADTHKSYIAALKDTTMSLEFLVDGTAAWAAVAPGTEGTLVVSPEGTTSGKPKYTAVGIVSKRSRSTPYNDVVVGTAEWNLQAAWTEGTN